jgi:hypothetical protein
VNLPALKKAYRRCGKLYAAIRELEDVVADLDDAISDQLLEQTKMRVSQLGHHLNVQLEEGATRGLGDPAVTGAAPDGDGHVPSAGEPVGRGRPKTRLRT